MKLTSDQQRGLDAVDDLVTDPVKNTLIITGSAGTGKSTLVRAIVKRNIEVYQTLSILHHQEPIKLTLSATTNKAAANLQAITGHQVDTVQKLLGMHMHHGKEYYPQRGKVHNTLLLIDEFSYIDEGLLRAIRAIQSPSLKIVFIGDECQLPPVKNPKVIPVMDQGFDVVELKQQVRQDTSVLKELGEDLKQFVKTGNLDDINADGKSLIHYTDPDKFTDEMLDAFNRGSCRFISYTNKRSVEINDFIHEERTGANGFNKYDEAVVNSHVVGPPKISTDTSVRISEIKPINYNIHCKAEAITIPGYQVNLYGFHRSYFLPANFSDYTYYKGNRDVLNQKSLDYIEQNWIDIRHQYACTVHKSQGSTYDEIFIDLTDFSNIRDQDTLARLLYVALTRAKKKIHIFGEI